jgi:hypothetical protein
VATLEQLVRAQQLVQDLGQLEAEILQAQATDGYLERLAALHAQIDEDTIAGLAALGLDDPAELGARCDALTKAIIAHRAARAKDAPNDEAVTADLAAKIASELAAVAKPGG